MKKKDKLDESRNSDYEKTKQTNDLVSESIEKAILADDLVTESMEKAKLAADKVISNVEKAKQAARIVLDSKEQGSIEIDKTKRIAELIIAKIDKAKRNAELIIATVNKTVLSEEANIIKKNFVFQNQEKQIRTDKFFNAKEEKTKRSARSVISNVEKAKQAAEVIIDKIEKIKLSADSIVLPLNEMASQRKGKQKHSAELFYAEITKAKRSAELVISSIDKAKQSAKLIVANQELLLAKRQAILSTELTILNKKLELANKQEKLLKEKYVELYDYAPSGYFILDRKGKILEANLSGATMLAKERQSLRNTQFSFFVSGDSKQIFNLFLSKAFNSNIKESCEVTLSTDINLPKYVYITGLAGKNGEGCHITMVDITRRKNAEKELQESNNFNKSLLKTIPFGMDIVDETGTILYQSDNFKKDFGESAIGAKCWELYRDDKKQCRDCPLLKGITIGEADVYESHGVLGGRIFNIIHTGMMYQGKKAMLEIFQDITETKHAEEKLRESESKYRELVENSPDAIIIHQKMEIVYANRGCLQLAGAEHIDDLKKKPLIEFVHPDFRGNAIERIRQLEKAGTVLPPAEEKFIRLDGSEFDVEVIGMSINFENKPAIQLIIRNITERKNYENELIAAKNKAEESDRLKSAFLTNMSHEIRTPMNGILGFTELLKEPNLSSDDLQDYIQTIQISGARMLNTINSIVDISKIESGLVVVDIKVTDINRKMEFTYKFFKPEVENKGLKFSFKTSLPSKEAIIKTDNEKVYGILTNLVRNAIKFTFDGSIEFGYEKKGRYLEFYVKDTGVGIPQKQYQIIFERFRQGSESHNRGYEGSGLGLSIAKSYVEMLGGEMWLESKEGLGSTFYFTIPYNPVSEEAAEIIDAASAENKEVQQKNLKILIVEDDEISYSLLSRVVQKISKEVLHAVTGVEAVEACKNNPDIDLVLMDIRMPRMNGLEATSQIRQFNKDVIIIAQTAYGFVSDSKKAMDAGCNDYLTKPIRSSLLFELIKKHVKKEITKYEQDKS